MTFVQGNEIDIYIFKEGAYKIAACGTSCSIQVAQELIPIATVSTGEWNDYAAGLKDVTYVGNGVVTLDQLGKVQVQDNFLTIGVRKQLKFVLTNSWGDEMSFEQEAIVQDAFIDGAAEGVATWSITWKGCGELTINETTFEALLDESGDPIIDENGEPIRV